MEVTLFREARFSELREAYITVKVFLEEPSGCALDSLQSTVGDDLGLAGDDVDELLNKFISTYNLSIGDFDFSKHFYSEGELFGFGSALFNIIVMIIRVVLWLIEICFFKSIRFNNKPSYFGTFDREVSDFTFRQMLVWYMEKDFKDGLNVSCVNYSK